MKSKKTALNKLFAIVLSAALALSLLPAYAAGDSSALESVCAFLREGAPSPAAGSGSGDWEVFVSLRSDTAPAGYAAAWYAALCGKLKDSSGVLTKGLYTEYSRTVTILSAAGYDASSVAGYDLTSHLLDTEKTSAQGVNGCAWALIALDSTGRTDLSAVKAEYISRLLALQKSAGGWAFGSGAPDPDITGMVLDALSAHMADSAVSQAVSRALTILSSMQKEDGGFASWGVENTESTAQVIIALCQLGIDIGVQRFVKSGKTALDALLSCRLADGSFSHIPGGEYDYNATVQAAEALAAIYRRSSCGLPLYSGAAAGVTTSSAAENTSSGSTAAVSQTAASTLPAAASTTTAYARTTLPVKTTAAAASCVSEVTSLSAQTTAAPSAVTGDVDGDGALTAADARLALRLAISLETAGAAALHNADRDGDGRVTAADARLLLRAAIGLQD